MPLENNHACLVNPNLTEVLGTQERQHNGKTYLARIARAKGQTKGSGERSFLYPIATWSKAEAQAHCKDHNGRFEAAKKESQEMSFFPEVCIECEED